MIPGKWFPEATDNEVKLFISPLYLLVEEDTPGGGRSLWSIYDSRHSQMGINVSIWNGAAKSSIPGIFFLTRNWNYQLYPGCGQSIPNPARESLNSASFGLVGKREKKKGGLAPPPFCPLGHRFFLLSHCFWKTPWYSFYSFCNWCLVFVKGYVLAFLSLHWSCKKVKCKWPCQRRNIINVFVMLSKFLRNY